METGFTVEGARSKRAVEADAQPSQQPMRPDKLRRNPDNGQKKVRRQLQRKTAAEDRKGHSVTCPRCGATGLRTSVHPDGSRLDAYCDNCHWRGTKTRKTKESTVDFNQREAQILTAMASAPLAEQARLAVELGEVRRQRTAALEADREIDVSTAVIRDHLTPVAVHTMNTTATDWLDEVETEDVGDTDAIVQAMRTEASLWFGRVGAEVKADSEEFGEQAQGMARYQASRFGMGAPVAQRAFLDHVAHLQKAGESAVVVEPLPDSGPGPQNDQTAPWTTEETTGDSNTDASAQVEEHTSSLRSEAYASHQTHSLISQSALRHLADDSPGKVDEDQSGNAESTITDYDTMGNDPEPFDEKMNGPLQPTGPFEVPSTRAPNVQGSLVAEGEYHYVHKQGDKWVITQKGTGKVLSTHDSEDKAKASFRAMMQSKHGGSLRPISAIAADIDIESVPPAAQPYLAAMDGINTTADRFGQDDGRTLVAYFLANAPGITQEAELRQHLAADPQSGEAQSHDKEVTVGNPNDRPMWEWELPELPGETGRDADDVAGVHTPGQGVADYPQPKSGSTLAGGGLDNLGDKAAPPFGKADDDDDRKESARQSGLSVQAGFPLCAAGCNQTLSAADVLVNTTRGLAHAACMGRTAEGTGEPMVQQGETLAPGDTGTIDSGRADPFVSEGQRGGEHNATLNVTAKPWMVVQRGTGTTGNQRYDSKEEAEAAAKSLNEQYGANDFIAKEEYPGDIGMRTSLKVREMEGRSYEATCPNPACEYQGTAFVHDDLAQDDDDEAVCPECETPLVWHNHTGSQHTAGNPHGVGTSQWFDWNDRVRAGEHPEGSGPHASDIPGGGIPLHGPLSEDQERWLHPPRHKRRMIDQEGKPYPRESALESSDPAGWYIIEDGKESGPFTDDEKAQMDSGNRHPYTWVRHGSLQTEAAINWENVVGSSSGNYIQGEYRGMHCELFYNNRLGHAAMAWDWSFYDDNSGDPETAVARSDEGFPTKEAAEADLINYIDGHVGEGRTSVRSSLQAEAGRMSERSGACADGDHNACKMSHGPGPDQCHCPYHGANTKPNRGRQHYSGACAAGDHGSCKMKHGNGPDECACPFGTHHTSSLREAAKQDRYRIVPSEQTGYGPGRHVVQKFYPDMKIWADVGDPRDTREEAEEHMRNQQKEARRSFVLAGVDQYGLHKAEPSSAADEERRAGYCKTCNQHVHRAPGGHGPVWVHTDGGMILGNEHGGLKGKRSALQVEAIRHYTHEELSKYPTIEQGHTDDLKLNTGTHKYWLSRMTKEDGEPYEHTVHVERRDEKSGGWTHHESYDGDNPSGKRSSLDTEAGVIGNSVSTHDLREGDTIVNHGMVLLLEDRKEYNGSGGGASESDQPTVTFKGKCLNMEEFAPGGSKADSFIYHFLKEDGGYWTVQGNKAATWWRIGKNSKLAAFRARVGAFVQRAALNTEASYYVHRKRGPRPDYGENDPPREGWVGPIRSPNQAEKERKAWEEAGHQAEVHPSSPEVRKRVRDWQKSVQERRKKGGSLQATAAPADGERSFCRICGRELEGNDYTWYALKDSPPKRNVAEHYCLPARRPGANWPGEYNAEGELVPGTPKDGGIYDAGAKLVPIEGSIDQSKLAAFRGRIAERL